MEELLKIKSCKYCQQNILPCTDEGLTCSLCQQSVHSRCLKRGTVPGGIAGDLFYIYTCSECSDTGLEIFVRDKLSWLQTIVMSLHHLQMKSGGLARKGFFHWRHHIVSFIDRNWQVLYPNEKPRKKRWMGTVSGRLSHYSSYLFVSGSKTAFNKPAWWTLMYPKVTPFVISSVYSALTMEKQKSKLKNEKKLMSDSSQFHYLLTQYLPDPNMTQAVDITNNANIEFENIEEVELDLEKKKSKSSKRKNNRSICSEGPKKLIKLSAKMALPALFEEPAIVQEIAPPAEPIIVPKVENQMKETPKVPVRLLDAMCYYNTSLNNISRMKMVKMAVKLTGGIRKEMILSPYSGIYLKPYIRRDSETFPNWLKLMAEIQISANKNNPDFKLPPRSCIEYTYVQPEHIPAINSLCNHFFWPGIDVTESLQYPDFSCVALYKRLIIGYAFLVPDVQHTENYISFVFTRPGWRNCGIGKFMIYHLIQTSLGRDITLHVSIDNPALFLYQKFGFKVENVVLDFYDKYFRNDVKESKNAFFCRLQR
ncbi:unnamed protein product [Ceutorhynchus assimilis]|uniref:N-acetyltransferase domain-containing protein n=1 Tax=Ceutorhynchus assimilis TaxID=467358 RepID=A0A9N9QCJ3_9CUCU|nr:unnamed protein product [Ceutorhynchus assimilis]